MSLRILLIVCLFLHATVGQGYEFADKATSAAASEVLGKLARVSSYYIESEGTIRHTKQGAPAAVTTTQKEKIWFRRPDQFRVERSMTGGPLPFREWWVSDGRMLRGVFLRSGQRTANLSVRSLAQMRAAKADVDSMLKQIIMLDVLTPFGFLDNPGGPMRFDAVSKANFGGVPCFRFRGQYKSQLPRTGGPDVGRIDLYVRQSDGILVHFTNHESQQSGEWNAKKILVNCNFPPGTFVFGKKSVGVPLTEVDETDKYIKAFRKGSR